MKIDFANLQAQYQQYKTDIDQRIQAVLTKSNYILGEEVNMLEQQLQQFTGVDYALSCSSGTDALLLALMAIDIQPGDEIITTPFSFISTAETIAYLKAIPIFVDIEEDTFNIDAKKIEQAITTKTKAIMPVSLYGQPADIDTIKNIAKQHKLKVIIDGAQSFGATYKGKTDSNLGDISITSFFPAKPLGCYGDGGAVFTNNEEYANKIKMLRVHGQHERYQHQYIGIGGRMDTLQAAILLSKLPYYPDEIKARQQLAKSYNEKLHTLTCIPHIKEHRTSVWAQYTLRVKDRNKLQSSLTQQDIPTAIHYPTPLHLQPCFTYLNKQIGDFPVAEKIANEVISLPMNAFLQEKEIHYIIHHIQQYLN